MRLTSNWQWEDGSTVPTLSPLCLKTDDALFANRVADYLESGVVAMAAASLQPDFLSESKELKVPLAWVTDGEWGWPIEMAFYARNHHVLPIQEFLDHMAANDYQVGPVAQSVVDDLTSHLRGE